MKKALVVSLMILAPHFAQAETMLYCRAAGNIDGITAIFAQVTDGTVRSMVIRDSKATPHSSQGSLETGFELSNEDRAWRGIDVVSLVTENGRYSLKFETLCNFSYQEETCSDGEVLYSRVDTEIDCTLVNRN